MSPENKSKIFTHTVLGIKIIKEIPIKGDPQDCSWKPGVFVEQNDEEGFSLLMSSLVEAAQLINIYFPTKQELETSLIAQWNDLRNKAISRRQNSTIYSNSPRRKFTSLGRG